MDALICNQPGSLELVRLPDPPARADAVLVRPRRVGICGTDYHIYEGKHPFLRYPRVMGHELAVEVVDAPPGSGVAPGETYVVNPYLSCGECIACRAGKPNCCVSISVLGVHRDGGMAELLSLPVENLVGSRGLSADECATAEFLSIGAHAVSRGGISGDNTVLVVGTGPIGLGVALFARLAGSAVAIYDRDEERANAARSITGATPLPAGDDLLRSVLAFTGGDGFDAVFDATGSVTAMQTGFDLVAHGGRYVLVSVVKDPITFSDPDFHRKEMTLIGSRNATIVDFENVIAAIRAGEVPIGRLITHRTNLADAVRNIPIWATQKAGLIKALIEIG